MDRFILLLILLASACAFGPEQAQGELDESGDSGSSGGIGDAAPIPTTSTRGMLDLDDEGGSVGGTGSSDDDSGEESTTDYDSGSESGSSDGSSSSSSGEQAEDPYGDCFDGPIEDGIKKCSQSCVTSIEDDFSACAPDCVDDACDGPGVCISEIAPPDIGVLAPVCVIPCSAGCPAGMECQQMDYAGHIWNLCMWE